MSNFGFKKPGASGEDTKRPGLDLEGIPTGPIALDPAKEREAVQRGEALGFTDRGQNEDTQKGRGRRRQKPPATPMEVIYVRAPKELAEWFQNYTDAQGHKAYWQSIQDMRDLIERRRDAGTERQPQE
ncbi:hypothetical protein [Sphingomonas sp. TREG-RG-20F-R18-01]|uniref:hypothetical protein n=1 Tax=Sphingomonas sp. TREG-RG-20F-R18-01 TaxID=2914982 RepID=UPI001F5730AD|nr:hypothetical protein [Sphingomonas sp. TREG-RG-20F-R18-01]